MFQDVKLVSWVLLHCYKPTLENISSSTMLSLPWVENQMTQLKVPSLLWLTPPTIFPLHNSWILTSAQDVMNPMRLKSTSWNVVMLVLIENAILWSSPSEEDKNESLMSYPRQIHEMHQVLAWVSRNTYTGCEQCTWITVWFEVLAFGSVCKS
jgi:hypothetical protein